ncbi:MAG: HlyC/CorC family transporter [Solobacterium sp.]|nr:HlyC/CorC family transporter [Solobacterium sp.]
MFKIYIIAVVLCVVASAFFSAAEMAYSSNNRIRLENAAEEGNQKAKMALKITEDYDNALSAILVGNNLVNIAASSLGALAVMITLGDDYTWLSTLLITVSVIIFGETIPKITAQKNATNFSMAFAGIMRFLMIIFKPVTWLVVHLVDLLTRSMKSQEAPDEEAAVEELHSIIETAESEDVIDEDSSELISAAIDFADVSVSEVMTARVDITAIDIDDDWDEILKTVSSSAYSRIPVYQDSIDNIIGILSLNRFLKTAIDSREFDIRTMLMQPYFVYKTTKLPNVLATLRDSQQHLAIVTDEYGGTLGVVTMEDVLEELVGEIWDETDTVEEEVSEISENKYVIDGDMSLSELIDLLDLDEVAFDFESETVGGWCIEMMDEFPEAGESFKYQDLNVKILEADERRVTRVEITRSRTENE